MFPGRLSVSKTFGDIEAKLEKYGGNRNVIVCEPEIFTFKMRDCYDFLAIGCDGIFEKLTNVELVDKIWTTL